MKGICLKADLVGSEAPCDHIFADLFFVAAVCRSSLELGICRPKGLTSHDLDVYCELIRASIRFQSLSRTLSNFARFGRAHNLVPDSLSLDA